MDSGRSERFERIVRLAGRFYGADVAFIGLIDRRFQWLKATTNDLLDDNVLREESACELVVAAGQPVVIGDIWSDPRMAGHVMADLPMRFYAGVPLIAPPDLVLGTLCVMNHEPGDPAAFDLGPLEELAAIAMDEIELWQLTRELRRRSQIDALTGLANRRTFDEHLEQVVRRINRTGAAASLLLIDIDHFKAINDIRGHLAGDEVLRQLGPVLAAFQRTPDDLVARYGGEEFAVILGEADAERAMSLAEAIRAEISRTGIPHPLMPHITASVGAATHRGPGANIERLIAAADSALYRAKLQGRNRIAFSERS